MKKLKLQFNEIINFFHRMIPDKNKHIAIAFFAGLSGVFLNMIVAYNLKGIYTAVSSKDIHLLFEYICIFILLLIGFFLYNCICWNLYGSSSAKIAGKLRHIILTKLCSLPISNVENNHSASIMSILTTDLDATQGIYVSIRQYISTLLYSIIPTIIVLRISRLIGLLIISMSILQLMVNFLVIKPLEAQSVKIRDNLYLINTTFSDVLHNNMSIRLYCSEDFYMEVSNEINQHLYNSNVKINLIHGVIESINICFGILGYILVLTTAGRLIDADKLTLPDLLFLTQMRLMMIQGILAFGNYAVQMQPAIVGIKKIMSFMDDTIENNFDSRYNADKR